jgi:hypothetical protein
MPSRVVANLPYHLVVPHADVLHGAEVYQHPRLFQLRKLRLRALQGRRFYRSVFARVETPLHTPTQLRPSDLAE